MFPKTLAAMAAVLFLIVVATATQDIYAHALTADPGLEGWQAVIWHGWLHFASFALGMVTMLGIRINLE